TLIAKAAMLLAVLAHFWLLRGFVKLLRGAWPNSLTDSARARLWAETRHNAVRLNLIAGATAALWMFVHGLGVGITHWAYLLSLGLLALLVTQGVILDGRMVRSAAVAGTFRPMFVLALSTLRQVSLAYGRAEACAALFLIACPVLANSIGATINRLASP
ncbi:MAG: hypothetical protein NT154_22450, partial [Verrucomicrobia bacterium]|nr:hypothetical protein [Verrucomicrobiota bacterium]